MASSPRPPDPYATASAQQSAELGSSQASSIINNANQYTPWGSRTYSQAGWETVYDAQGKALKVPRYNETTTLSPDQMRLLGLQTQMQYNMGQTGVEQSSKLREHLGKGVDTSGLPAWNAGPAAAKLATGYADVGGPQRQLGGGGAIRQDQGPTNREALEKAMLQRYDRDAATRNANEQAQLAARGMTPGSAGYGAVTEAQDRARTDAAGQAYLASGQESRAAQEAYNQAQRQRFEQGAVRGQFANQAQQQAEAQALARAGFSNEALANMWNMQGTAADRENALRAQQLQEILALRNQPINEITALLGGSQVTAPQFQPFSRQGVNAAPIGSYIANNYAGQVQQAAAANQGIFNLGSAALTGGFGPGGFFR